MGMNALVKQVLDEVGIKPERYSLAWASAAEAPRFVKLITDFTAEIRALGAIGEVEGLSPDELKTKITISLNLLQNRKLRMGFGNATKAVRKEGDFRQEHITKVFEQKLTKTIAAGLVEEGVLVALQQEPTSLTNLTKQIGASGADLKKLLATLKKQGKVEQKDAKWMLVAA